MATQGNLTLTPVKRVLNIIPLPLQWLMTESCICIALGNMILSETVKALSNKSKRSGFISLFAGRKTCMSRKERQTDLQFKFSAEKKKATFPVRLSAP